MLGLAFALMIEQAELESDALIIVVPSDVEPVVRT
jgi:hypothetical protein